VSRWITEYADSKLDDRIGRLKADIPLLRHIPDRISTFLTACAQLPSDMSNLAQYAVTVIYARAMSDKLLGFYITIAIFDFCTKAINAVYLFRYNFKGLNFLFPLHSPTHLFSACHKYLPALWLSYGPTLFLDIIQLPITVILPAFTGFTWTEPFLSLNPSAIYALFLYP
jgi:hypothetical protein